MAADRLPRIVTDEGNLDPMRLQEALHVLHSDSREALQTARSNARAIEGLLAWKEKIREATAFADGVAAGRTKIFGFLHVGVVLAFGMVGALGSLFGAFVAAKQAGLF